MLRNLLRKMVIILKPFLSIKILIIYLPIYFCCTGWVFLSLIPGMPIWFKTIAASWYAILWMPWMPEKLITIPLTIFLYKKIFLNPNKPHNERDAKRIQDLEDLVKEEKEKFKNFLARCKERRIERKTQKYLKKTKK